MTDCRVVPEGSEGPRAGEPSISVQENNPELRNLRYVIIEYKAPYRPAEVLERDQNVPTGPLEESGFRSSTMISGFRHANLVLLRPINAEDGLKGIRWSLGKNSAGIRVKRGVHWDLEPSSRFLLEGITVKDDAEINKLVDGFIDKKPAYKLLDNNCEGFCKFISRQIVIPNVDEQFTISHHRLLNGAFTDSKAAGVRYVGGLSWDASTETIYPGDPHTWTSSTAIGFTFLVQGVVYWIVLSVLVIIGIYMVFPEYAKLVTYAALACLSIAMAVTGLTWALMRPGRLHERDINQAALTEDKRQDRMIWFATILASIMLFFVLFGAASLMVFFLTDGRDRRNFRLLYAAIWVPLLISLGAYGIVRACWVFRREHNVDASQPLLAQDESEETEESTEPST